MQLVRAETGAARLKGYKEIQRGPPAFVSPEPFAPLGDRPQRPRRLSFASASNRRSGQRVDLCHLFAGLRGEEAGACDRLTRRDAW